MGETFRSRIMEEADVRRALARIAHEIIERNGKESELILLGVVRRGAPLAATIAENIERFSDIKVHLADIDITYFRDDIEDKPHAPILPDFNVEGKTVILVDDVIYTGRTVRAAIDGLFRKGRPRTVQLAVLVDRGLRELPFKPDYVGKNIPTSHSERVRVSLSECDGEDLVIILERE